jgi:hypothetical protein
MVMLQVPVPEQAPVQPSNEEPVVAAAVSVTAVPLLNRAEQAVPQLMAAGLLVIVPEPVPDELTVS